MPDAHSATLALLRRGLVELREDPESHPCLGYLRFLDLLFEWNRRFNLTAIRDEEQSVAYHLLDSLSILPFLKGDSALDVGSGAGLPGLVLALARPDMRWTLLDSNSKKVRFLEHALGALRIRNAEVIQGRLGQVVLGRAYSTVVTRAVALTPRLLKAVRSTLGPAGVFLAMKGADPSAEMSPGMLRGWQADVRHLHVPGVTSERNLLLLHPRPPAGSG